MKQRFSALDVRAMVTALRQRVVGLRLQGIYDVNAKTFLFKFTKPECKQLVLVESGIRLHTTEYTRDKSVVPSGFCMKLRKHLRARRLTAVRQVGMDRVVDFEFAVAAGPQAEGSYHIICEFYASGNIILTDHEYRILALVRVVHLEDESFAVGKTYALKESRDIEPVDRDQLMQCLRAAGPKDTLKRTLATLGAYGPSLAEHVILRAQLGPSKRVSQALDLANEHSPQIDALLAAYADAFDIVKRLGQEICPGYITCQPGSDSSDQLFDEFGPWLFDQYQQKPYKESPSFADAADVFFSNIEAQKLKVRAHQQEQAAERKLDAIKAEHEGRVVALEQARHKTEEQARRIEMNLEFVDQAITIIRQAVAAGMDWEELGELVRDQQDQGNPVAERITRLNLAANQITLTLDYPADSQSETDSDSDDDDHDIGRGPLSVDVDIFESAFANAQRYYTSRRQAGIKHAKTLAVSSQALQSAEQKIKTDLRAIKITSAVTQQRKPLWFEKFSWFISSDGYLVLAGHDMHQNELLVKRYLRAGDAYVHADLHGAASVVVKNRSSSSSPLPPSTLFQAGIMSVCQSRAWDAKIVTSAWWVEAHQVSKTAPTGEFLTTGSFMIRGKKNFLPPTQLVYGFGFLFRLADDESIARHSAARQQRLALMEESLLAAGTADAKDDIGDDADAAEAIVGGSAPAEEMDFSAARKKYNLEEVELATAEPEQEPVSKPARGESKRNISAKERRDQRKQKSGAAATAGSDGKAKLSKQEQRRLDEEAKYEKANNQKQQQQQQQQQQKRGKKGKLRKMKEKYADQDDEDRELRMAILGTSGKNVNDVLQKKAMTPAETLAPADDHDDDHNENIKSEAEDAHQQPALSADANTTDEKPAVTVAANDDNGDHDAEDGDAEAEAATSAEHMDVLDMLTGTPLPGDNLSSAIPMCAPYSALSSCKYRVKLVPGSMKKGKACKMAVTVMLAAADGNKPRSVHSSDAAEAERLELQNILANREKELMKVVPEPEMIAQMLGKVKVTAPNMESLRQKSKAAAKSRAKSKEQQ
ncbi:hypothetical protein H4R99_001645 [Coemansia sp. RSA 1722]|nr:hypothetical protein IWW45_002281 [Coemansia sp. RSA 485]KAJ2597470.1 hypothetical protein GGF39_003036 [Coemansia sp. RSA 1721]KAJ2604680.1 hypothetical protein H4R99_001645 [Coemansia sp. RSA 1722]